MVFIMVDTLWRNWQIPLAEKDQSLTTCMKPFGRFPYCRGPMGFVATDHAFYLRRDTTLRGLTNCMKVVDNLLLSEKGYLTHLHHNDEGMISLPIRRGNFATLATPLILGRLWA